jgi:hypothetical protein
MSRLKSKSLDQVESDFIFKERDVKAPAEPEQQDKRSAPKEFIVERNSATGLFRVKLSAGGEAPDVLKGHWTSATKAQAEVDNYLATREQTKAG